jgi:putative peptidoglycan lipid II flippase
MLVSWTLSDHVDLLVTLILLPIPMLASLAAIYTGLLNAEDRYRLAVLSPAYGSVFAFLIILLMPVTPAGLAAILVSFEVGRVVGLKFHIPSREKADESDASTVVNWALRGAGFQAIGSFLVALNPLVDRLFAKGFGIGAISDVEYAGRLWNMVPLFFTGTLTIIYATWSRTASNSKLDIHRVHVSAACLGGTALVFSVLVIIGSDLLINTLYGWGKIGVAHRASLSALLRVYLAGSAPFVATLVYVRALSALGRIPLVTAAAGINAGVNLILDWIMTSIYGLIGIGLATSITYLVVMLFLVVCFEKISSEPTITTHSE